MILSIHVAAGGVALVLGAVALSARKGGTLHRRGGLLFVVAMSVMAVTAPMAAALGGGRVIGNALGGLMTIYFVVTALAAVRPASPWTRPVHVAALPIAAGLALLDLLAAVGITHSPAPAPMLLVLTAVMTLAAIGDLRVVRFGLPRGGKRLARHLWRMCFALFIAAGSFFSIRERVAKILPAPFASGPMRALPILLLFAVMFYWLWRVRSRRALPIASREETS